MDENAVHQLLLSPDAYPEKSGPISFDETHISYLYFTDSHVYKIKKPLNLGFLDFSTLEKRLFFCQEEVRLNRRFCPDTYLDVVPIKAIKKGLRLGGPEGEIVEYAVRMKRLPKERMLDVLLERDDPSLPKEMEKLASFLAEVHRQAPLASEVAPSLCDWDDIGNNWNENFSQTEPFAEKTIPADGLEACRHRLEALMREDHDLFMRREREGFVREVHGDLHAEHICLTRPVRIYDCIEFNQRFRISDILSDLAFLLMDLEFRGRRDLAGQLLDAYLAHSEPQEGYETLLRFYKIYRAWVRGKVDAIAMHQHPPGEEAFRTARELACRYFNLAMGYLSPPFLLITCGLMGTGKSVFSRRLAQASGATLLQSDAIRKQLAGIAPGARAEVAFETGIYRPTATETVYHELHLRAAHELRKGNSVIVDASFAREKHRRTMEMLAKSHGVGFFLAHLVCQEATHRERLTQRELKGGDISDGRLALLEKQTAKFENIEETPHSINIDTTREVEYNIGLALSRILKGVETQA